MSNSDVQFRSYFDLMEAFIEDPVIESNRIVIPIHNLVIWPGHAEYPDGIEFDRCYLIFSGVRSAKRKQYDYVGVYPHDKLSDPQMIVEGPFAQTNDDVFLYEFGAPRPDKTGYTYWEIESAVIVIAPDDVSK